MIGTWVEETNRLILEILDSRSETETMIILQGFQERMQSQVHLGYAERRRRLVENIEDTLYNEEFDPGSG